jgi:hypothetical protein
MNRISLQVFEDTLKTLEDSLTPPPANDRERDEVFSGLNTHSNRLGGVPKSI